MLQVLNQDETPLLYSLVFGEGVVNDATSVVLFNAVQNFDLSHIDAITALQLIGNFIYLFISSTLLGVFVSLYLSIYTPPLSLPPSVSIHILVIASICVWFLNVTFCFHLLQAGLLSAFIIKKLYFGRLVILSHICSIFSALSQHREIKFVPVWYLVGYLANHFYVNVYFVMAFRHSTDREVAIMILMAYLSYMLAEVRKVADHSASSYTTCYLFLTKCWSPICLAVA